jgi:ribosomal 30S subunit maturation factor RimM
VPQCGVGDREFTVAERKGTDAKPIIRLTGVDDRDAAEALRGESLSEQRRASRRGRRVAIEDLVGCRIEGIGEVTACSRACPATCSRSATS